MTERSDNSKKRYAARLEAMARTESPMGSWYRNREDDEAMFGDLTTKGANAFIFAAFHAYMDACDNQTIIAELDEVLEDPATASRILDNMVIRPAYEAFQRFYAEHFGDPVKFQIAYFKFCGETDLIEIRAAVTQICYEQRKLECSIS